MRIHGGREVIYVLPCIVILSACDVYVTFRTELYGLQAHSTWEDSKKVCLFIILVIYGSTSNYYPPKSFYNVMTSSLGFLFLFIERGEPVAYFLQYEKDKHKVTR